MMKKCFKAQIINEKTSQKKGHAISKVNLPQEHLYSAADCKSLTLHVLMSLVAPIGNTQTSVQKGLY